MDLSVVAMQYKGKAPANNSLNILTVKFKNVGTFIKRIDIFRCSITKNSNKYLIYGSDKGYLNLNQKVMNIIFGQKY